MSIEQDKKVGKSLSTGSGQSAKLNLLDEFTAPTRWSMRCRPACPPTVEGTKMFFGMMFAAFPDLQYTVEDTIGEGDRIAQRVTAHATMKGDFLGMPATGKSATWSEMHILRLKDGKVVRALGCRRSSQHDDTARLDAWPEVIAMGRDSQ